MLERSHFDIDAAFPLTLTPEKVRALWRFQFNAITDGGQALREHFYAKAESLLVVAQSSGLDRSRSASSRLALLKGAEPCRYDPGSIRAAVGAINKVFDGLHCADEPIDVLREMGVIFGERQLQDAYRQVARGPELNASLEAGAVLTSVYERSCEHDLDVRRATARLRRQIEAAASALGSYALLAAHLLALLEEAEAGAVALDWFNFARDLTVIGLNARDWDVLLVASQYGQYDIPGASKLIGNLSDPRNARYAPQAEGQQPTGSS